VWLGDHRVLEVHEPQGGMVKNSQVRIWMLRRVPPLIALLTLRLVRLIFACNFSADTTQEDMLEAPVALGKYERLFHRAYVPTLLSPCSPVF
jgi:hypothetical protein